MSQAKTPQTLNEAIELICQEYLETFLKKHKDYGKGNILSIKELGMAFRMSEKTERLKNLLMKDSQPENESIEDTLTDIGVYSIISHLYRRGWFQELEVEQA